MAGLQQFYFFPTDFLDTIRHHPSLLPLTANDGDAGDDGKRQLETVMGFRGSFEKLKDNYKNVKIISSDPMPRSVVAILKQKPKVDL